ncbi:TPA: conjugal transfer protein TraX [Pseudomonas aeruginosa]|nr:conjugal transfer protein TraX [Pseudomonas aeruginosa]HBO4599511.1 conjugal transfer protein TraX [Pseudomonas aeruginosa]HBP6529065.1 conjugal transfer protein TraX [Pseudomonas aeruginosa]HBP6574842.1 conjugal transfer protein TraX [Pseudomonas aeruginosa]HCF6075110.1 conjugal transfer protein TraX [Pseudomonas aeruginosa]
MVLDHLRYLWPSADWLFVLGRLAFPLFCLAIAVNVVRAPIDSLFSDANARYLTWLVAFSALSEIPYRWLSFSASTINVMPTLMLGLVVAWGAHYRSREALLLAGFTVVLAATLHPRLMYGVFGVVLPAAFVVALRQKRIHWLLPALICLAANARNRWMEVGEPMAWLIALAALAAPLVGLWLAGRSMAFNVWPVKRWGYWFYPVHLAVIGTARLLL